MKSETIRALALAGLLAGTVEAKADVWWTLKDVTFADGSAVTGSFDFGDYYATPALVTTLNGTAADGTSTIDGYAYTFGTDDASNIVTFHDTDGTGTPDFYSHYITLTFQDSLRAPLAENVIVAATSYECVDWSCPSDTTSRYVASGFASAPEPPTWAMMIVGAGVLGLGGAWLRRRPEAA